MSTTVNQVIVNKLLLSQYRQLKNNNQVNTNECYSITDIDEYTPTGIVNYDVSNPTILRNLSSGFYSIIGYFRYYSSQSGISGVDPAMYAIVEHGDTYSLVTILSCGQTGCYKIYDSSYEDLNDTGWIDSTLTSNFKSYGNDSNNLPQYRKKNGVVYIRGCVSPNVELAGSATAVTIFTLPSGFRPTRGITKLCQGSGKNTWCLDVKTSGAVTFSRYGTTANATASTSVWLPFEISFPI